MRNPNRVCLIVVVCLIVGKGLSQNPNLDPMKSFELFSDCLPIHLYIGELSRDASKIGLTKESIQAAVESRLRSARLYDSETFGKLGVVVGVSGENFGVNLSYAKLVYDAASNRHDFAWTWQKITLGSFPDFKYFLAVFRAIPAFAAAIVNVFSFFRNFISLLICWSVTMLLMA